MTARFFFALGFLLAASAPSLAQSPARTPDIHDRRRVVEAEILLWRVPK